MKTMGILRIHESISVLYNLTKFIKAMQLRVRIGTIEGRSKGE